jgi:molybdopterin-guanine dinucleotide biosynthesis protein A
MLALVLARLRAVAQDVFIVANDAARYEPFGVRVAPDIYQDGGPLAGIYAAIRQARYDHCLVVACDMPFLSPPLLARMAREPRDYDVLAPVVPGASRQGRGDRIVQTLHAIYGKRCIPAIEARLAEGNRQVVGFFEAVVVRELDVAEVDALDPGRRSFFNANTPEALAAARAMARGEEPSSSP